VLLAVVGQQSLAEITDEAERRVGTAQIAGRCVALANDAVAQFAHAILR
jgi:hypothetical protein